MSDEKPQPIESVEGDKVTKETREADKNSRNEAVGSLDQLVQRNMDAMADQTDAARLADPTRAKVASINFGRPEIFGDDGEVLVRGLGNKGAAQADRLPADIVQYAADQPPLVPTEADQQKFDKLKEVAKQKGESNEDLNNLA